MKVQLCSGWEQIPTQLVFGELANLAWPIVIHYRSDLYHDAQWLQDNLQVGVPLYYGVRDTGTDIGNKVHMSNRSQQYLCELTLEDGAHYLNIQESN